MTGLFEKHLGRKMKPSEGQEEQLFYLSLILTPKELKERETLKKKQHKQLKLF